MTETTRDRLLGKKQKKQTNQPTKTSKSIHHTEPK